MLPTRWLPCSLLLVACAGSTRYRHELVGHGNGVVTSRVAAGSPSTDLVAAPGAGGIQLPQGNYQIAMRFDVPRAQTIDWKVVCPGVAVDGQVGETFEEYRARRIEEIQRERERERERIAAATSIVVGAVAPRVEARTKVGNADVHARAHVDAHAAGVAAAHGVVPDSPIELAPGDVGRGTVTASARVMTAGDGVCALHAAADDADVRAMFSVTRIRDLHAEERMRTIAAREVAVKVRGDISAQLVTRGADPTVHQRRIAAEAARAEAELRARAEARARVEAQVRARAELRARLESDALYARQLYVAYLTGKCNAEPGRRERLAEEERRRREARLVADAVLAQRLDQAALAIRDRLRGQLVAFGAKARPPKPEPLPEHPGAPPFTGAAWIAGRWLWTGTAWHWEAGGWSDPTVLGEGGSGVVVEGGGGGDIGVGDILDVGVDVGVGVGAGAGVSSTRSHAPGVRDHRSHDTVRVRDHRDHDTVRVRDHREHPRTWTPRPADDPPARVRDHRSKDDDKDDDPPRVRDHRRR